MMLNNFAARFIDNATRDDNDVYTMSVEGERYEIDFAHDFEAEGWEQFDTSQDAWYFGVWVNPSKLLQLTFAEGDWTLTVSPDADRYNRSIDAMIRFYDPGYVAITIDDDDTTVYRQERAEFYIAA